MSVIKVDNSMLTCFHQDCERKFFWRYMQHLVKVGCEGALKFGEAIHAACDKFWAGESVESALSAFDTLVTEDLDEKRTVRLGHDIINMYYTIYAPSLEEFELLGLEQSLMLPINEEIEFWGRLDKVVRWQYGVSAIDHKTSSLYLSMFKRGLSVSHQFTAYMAILKTLYEDAFGLIVDMIHVPKPNKDGTLIRRDGSSLLDFDRVLTSRSDFDIEEWKDWVVSVTGDIRTAQLSERWRKSDNCCYSFNRECPYMGLCERQEPLNEQIEFAHDSLDFTKREWTPWEIATNA